MIDENQERDRPRVSVVCPFFNEEAIIAAAAKRMIANLDRQFPDSWELILVDDGSKDRSLARLEEALADRGGGRVRVYSYPVNQGRGRALKIGIDHARSDIVVTTEVDCSWGDDIVQRLAGVLEARPEIDFVIASPHLPGGGFVNVPRNRVFITRLGNYLIRRFFASNVTMNTGMTRAYRRRIIQPLVVYEGGKEFHLEVLLKLLTLAFRFVEIPAVITWQDHKLAGESRRKRKSSTRIGYTIQSHLRFIVMARPFKYFAWFSALSLLAGIVCVGGAVWQYTAGRPSILLLIVGLIFFLFCAMFVGLAVLFYQIREGMRDEWVRYYPEPHPPAARAGRLVFPAP